jgi:hypothetical protein
MAVAEAEDVVPLELVAAVVAGTGLGKAVLAAVTVLAEHTDFVAVAQTVAGGVEILRATEHTVLEGEVAVAAAYSVSLDSPVHKNSDLQLVSYI